MSREGRVVNMLLYMQHVCDNRPAKTNQKQRKLSSLRPSVVVKMIIRHSNNLMFYMSIRQILGENCTKICEAIETKKIADIHSVIAAEE